MLRWRLHRCVRALRVFQAEDVVQGAHQHLPARRGWQRGRQGDGNHREGVGWIHQRASHGCRQLRGEIPPRRQHGHEGQHSRSSVPHEPTLLRILSTAGARRGRLLSYKCSRIPSCTIPGIFTFELTLPHSIAIEVSCFSFCRQIL